MKHRTPRITMDGIVLLDGLEDAFLGLCEIHTKAPRGIYDWAKCVEIFMERDGMTYDDAVEWMDHNVTCLWAGEGTPAFLYDKLST
jgi:hypothetical protein